MLWHAQILLPTCSPKVYALKTREKMQNSSQKNIKKQSSITGIKNSAKQHSVVESKILTPLPRDIQCKIVYVGRVSQSSDNKS